jgi:hypothetical protein
MRTVPDSHHRQPAEIIADKALGAHAGLAIKLPPATASSAAVLTGSRTCSTIST